MAGYIRIAASGASGLYLGSLSLSDPRELRARQTFDGLIISLPVGIKLERPDGLAGYPVLSGIRANVFAFSKEIGVAYDCDDFHPVGEHDGFLDLAVSAAVVRRIETERNGAAFDLKLSVRAVLYILRSVDLAQGYGNPQSVDQQVSKTVLGEPARIWGHAEAVIDPQVWAAMLNATGLGENVFVEIPLPPRPAPEWQDVWKALRTAREALNRGGATAWKSVVTESRLALEKWHDLEQPDHGLGWQPPSRSDKEARTKQQRHDNLRWHLLQCAHKAVHSHADEWTRDDAVLILSTLASLLATRKP